ncbi:MAG: ferrochelatase [Moraxellaceae bacterium]|nr:ferrochelatase [Moraxellaceae bacterium]
MTESPRRQVGVLLANLGTPDAPTTAAVRRFLRQFLSDRRVIEVPRPIWWLVLNAFILPFRPRRVARLYQSIWEREGDSPMRRILREQCALVQRQLSAVLPHADVHVLPAMSYGNPSVASALDALQAKGVEQVVVLPLFPQYSATSTAPVADALARWQAGQRNLLALTLIKDYFRHPVYIAALAASVQAHRREHGTAEKLLFSFHGIPQSYADKGDPYPSRCRETAERVAAALQLPDDAWAFSFQSRFGPQAWVKPYTDHLLESWGRAGVASVQVVCPAFSADCLETLEEIAEENREGFLQAGGKDYQYIPALNVRADHVALMSALVRPHLEAFLGQ